MKNTVLAGVALIVLGIFALAYQGFSYTKEKKVLDLGPIEATKKTTERVSIPPILGGVAVVGGVALVFAGRKSS